MNLNIEYSKFINEYISTSTNEVLINAKEVLKDTILIKKDLLMSNPINKSDLENELKLNKDTVHLIEAELYVRNPKHECISCCNRCVECNKGSE